MPAKVTKSDSEWRAELSDLAYKVTRKGATERAGSHDNFPSEAGEFTCICCGAALFDASAKFESGTGWPSFFQPIATDRIGEKSDNKWFMNRTEVHCTACESHLGHVFPDGPQPTGLRYCLNGVALKFKPKNQS